MNEVLLQAIVTKLEKQERTIQELKEKFRNQPDVEALINEVKNEMEEVKITINAITFPTREMKEFSTNLVKGVQLLKQPVENKVVHHHHVGIGIFVIIVLCISLIAAGSGLYFTGKTLNVYKAADTKYRYLKLRESKTLRQLLAITDSLYRVDSGMRDSVLRKEEQLRDKLEMLQQAKDMEEEARQLKKKAKGK